jgi:hypothetical protein
MKVGRILTSFIMLLVVVYTADAQLIKAFSSTEVADNYRAELRGNKNNTIRFRWTSADLNKPNVNLVYSFQIDTVGGGFNNPWTILNEQCCANFFTDDTTMDISLDYLADELDVELDDKYGKRFRQGDSITLEWIIMCNATGPNASFENRQTQTKKITFVRGQFDKEYVPVNLVTPLDNSSFFVEDNPNVLLKFQWTKAYCPTGCSAPTYRIMFDNLGGNFSQPLYFFDVPQSSSDTILDLRQDVLAQMMYDDGMPINTPKTYKWTVEIFGNGQQLFAWESKRISLQRGLMKFENKPFFLETPVDNAVFKLETNTNDSIVFSWNETRTGLPDAAKYSVLFTDAANVDFANPIFKLNTNVGDTTYIARYGSFRDSLDKTFGKNWTSQDLKWTVEADIIGFKFMCNDTNDIRIARGFFTGVNHANETFIRAYPNPTSKHLNISVDAEPGINRIEICDALGRVVMNKAVELTDGNLHLDVSNLNDGLYYIRLHNKNQAIRPIAFIKQ